MVEVYFSAFHLYFKEYRMVCVAAKAEVHFYSVGSFCYRHFLILEVEMKKLTQIVVLLMLVCVLLCAFAACAPAKNPDDGSPSGAPSGSSESETTVVDPVKYFIPTGEDYAVVIGCKEGAKNIVIASEYNGKPVKKIGKQAFLNAVFSGGIESIYIPNSITEIGEDAFLDCGGIIYCEAKSKPSTWSSNFKRSAYVKNYVVWDCKNNNVAEDGYIYTITEDMIYGIKNGEATLFGTIDVAFRGEKVIPSNVNYNGVNYSVTTIDCSYSSSFLNKIVLPNSISEIKEKAFNGCICLESIVIPDNVTTIGKQIFSTQTKGMTIYCESEVKPIGWDEEWNSQYPIVWNCNDNDIADDGYIYTLVDGVKYAIKAGEAIVAIQPCGEVLTYDIKDSILYKGVSYSVSSIKEYAFTNVFASNVLIPESITTIEENAFLCGSTLMGPFVYCESKTKPNGWADDFAKSSPARGECKVIWDSKNNDIAEDGLIYTVCDGIIYTINDGFASAIQPATYEEVLSTKRKIIPSTIEHKGINYKVENICNIFYHYREVVIPETVKTIETANASMMATEKIIVEENNNYFKSIDGNLYSKDGTVFYKYADGEYSREGKEKDFVIPNGVTTIADNAFGRNSTNLQSLTIPNSVNVIEGPIYNASIIIYCEAKYRPNGWSTDWINEGTPIVWDCNNNLVANDGYIYTIVKGVKYALKNGEAIVSQSQFKNIISAEIEISINFAGSFYPVMAISEDAFSCCNYLTNISIPDIVEEIGSFAFSGCFELNSIVIPNSVKSIRKNAFSACSSLTTIKFSGTMAQWNSIIKGYDWNEYIPATVVECTDGNVEI